MEITECGSPDGAVTVDSAMGQEIMNRACRNVRPLARDTTC